MTHYRINKVKKNDFENIRLLRNLNQKVLRNNKNLTIKDQNLFIKYYFNQLKLKPNQILFSIFYKDYFIGYGGLVHISYINKKAEISFLTIKERETIRYFKEDFLYFHNFIINYAFKNILLNKLSVEVFSFRNKHIHLFKKIGFKTEGVLKREVKRNGRYYDSVLLAKFNAK